jgi:hypothetical protein
MKKKKAIIAEQEKPVKKLKNFRFPAKGDRKACTIQAESLSKAIELYNNK